MRIGITGATGLIGRAFGQLAAAHGHEVVAFTRDRGKADLPFAKEVRSIQMEAALPLDASGLEVLVHLAGESVMGRWTAAKKQRIHDSRVDLTQKIARCLAAASPRPRALLCGSATGFYGDCGDEVIDESTPPGSDFLARVCVEWEAAAQRAEQVGIRVVRLRTGIVLANEGGAFKLMRLAFSNLVGGRLGSGQQWMPWIHLQDEVRMILWAAERNDFSGQLNLVSPQPVRNADLTRALGRVLHRPAIMPAPAFAMKLVLGEMADALLGSQRVMPSVAQALGFQFDYPTLDAALESLVASKPEV
jgi:hypothetical protein